MTFAVGTTVLIGIIGTSMDYSMASTAGKRAQQVADTVALNGAIFVKNEGYVPMSSEDAGLPPGTYTATQLDIEFRDFVNRGSDGVNVNVAYNDTAKEVTVTVSGETNTTFTRVLGKEHVEFSSKAVVSYMEVDNKQPASIALVLDNSGSMRRDDKPMIGSEGSVNTPANELERPADAVPRIDALKTSVKNFRNDLRRRIGKERKVDGQRVLRTGILPYNSEIKDWTNNAATGMLWGFAGINNNHVDNMQPEGGTNSNPPMAKAKQWLEVEEDKHRAEATRTNKSYKEPLKFVVFMTDGQNTTGNFEFVADDTTGRWYAFKSFDGNPPQWWVSGRKYDSDFEEGRLELDSDKETIKSCEAMHADGVEIFTIGYALDVGQYWDPLTEKPQPVTEKTKAVAYGLLAACASEPANFIKATDGTELNGAFNQIQNSIVEELIRMKS